MYAAERHERILELLAAEGRVRVGQLAAQFDVAEETIRRDLSTLEQAGLAHRVHGGAVPFGVGVTTESELATRLTEHADEKRRIAARALGLIPSGTPSVFIDAGSTTLALASALAAEAPAGMRLLTNSVPVAVALGERADLEVDVVGGTLRGLTRALVGPETERALGELRVDIAFIGTNGISAEHGFSTPDQLEAATKRAIVGAARIPVVLADATKFGQELLHRFAAISDIATIVTDAPPPAALAGALLDAGTEVVLA